MCTDQKKMTTDSATEKQLAALKRFWIWTIPDISAGEASDLIAEAIGRTA
jgi:hypothetical protein